MKSGAVISFVVVVIQQLLFSTIFVSGNSIKVSDSKNSRLYRGPENPYRSDLSSYILRAKPTEASSRYFTGSPKPIWDDPPITRRNILLDRGSIFCLLFFCRKISWIF
jgi:hypothetical protein